MVWLDTEHSDVFEAGPSDVTRRRRLGLLAEQYVFSGTPYRWNHTFYHGWMHVILTRRSTSHKLGLGYREQARTLTGTSGATVQGL